MTREELLERTKKVIYDTVPELAGVELKEAADRHKENNESYSFFQNMMKKFSKDYSALHKYKNKIPNRTILFFLI